MIGAILLVGIFYDLTLSQQCQVIISLYSELHRCIRKWFISILLQLCISFQSLRVRKMPSNGENAELHLK